MSYSKADFLKRLSGGNKTEALVAEKLREAGISVEIPEVPEGMPTSYYTKNQVDLIANGHILEVKGRTLRFDHVANYPYKTLFIESTSGFDRKANTPSFYVNVSNPTGAIIALDVDATKHLWTVDTIQDRKRPNLKPYDMYIAEATLWMDWDDFVRKLQ